MKASLEEKLAHSIELLQKGERLALSLSPGHGYMLSFSGGKDSQVLMEVAKMAGVKYRAEYYITSIDPPENVYFIRKNYPEVNFIHPKKNFFRLIEEKGLPTMWRRYCCERLKEGQAAQHVVITGVRAAESRKRASMHEIEIYSRRVEHQGKDRQRTIEQLEENEHRCIRGKDKIMMRPIFNWTDEEVWEFIEMRHLPVNPCYKEYHRVGCMFCPFASTEELNRNGQKYPLFERNIIRALTVYWRKCPTHPDASPEEYYKRWKTKR